MTVKCSDIIKYMEELAPPHLAEDWDNVGLLLGGSCQDIERIMVCLDVTEKVAQEAVSQNVDLIISHHPIIFKGMKRITNEDYKGKVIYQLIRNNIGVYSAHTNLDTTDGGVNERLAGVLGLEEVKNLNRYKSEKLFKIVVFVPEESIENVRNAMSKAGAGWIGNYSDCSFMMRGTGTFRPLEGTNPYKGTKDKLEKVDEIRLETIVPQNLLKKVTAAMLENHPYEEVAYDIYQLELKGKEYGLGKVGVLSEAQTMEDFIGHVKSALNVERVRIIGTTDKKIKKVAVFCGSFDEDYSGMIESGADVLVTGDIKYHAALDITEKGMCVIDAGHFNTEHIMVPELVKLLKERFRNIDVFASTVETDPIKIS